MLLFGKTTRGLFFSTDLPEACQLPPGCSALRHRRMPGRHHPPVGTQQATAPDPQPGDPPESGRGPETRVNACKLRLCPTPTITMVHTDNWVENSIQIMASTWWTHLPWSAQQSPVRSPQGCECFGHARRAASWCCKKMREQLYAPTELLRK